MDLVSILSISIDAWAIQMEVELSFRLQDAGSNIRSEGLAKAVLDERYLTLGVEFGEPLLVA